jgi:hypothetical protein
MNDEIQRIENELHYFLREDIGEFKYSIIDTIVDIDIDPTGGMLIEIHRDGTYETYFGRKVDFSVDDNNFRYQFSYISPDIVDGFDDLHVNSDGLWENYRISYDDDEDLLDAAKDEVFCGRCINFESEWFDFLDKFDKWYKKRKIGMKEGGKE